MLLCTSPPLLGLQACTKGPLTRTDREGFARTPSPLDAPVITHHPVISDGRPLLQILLERLHVLEWIEVRNRKVKGAPGHFLISPQLFS